MVYVRKTDRNIKPRKSAQQDYFEASTVPELKKLLNKADREYFEVLVRGWRKMSIEGVKRNTTVGIFSVLYELGTKNTVHYPFLISHLLRIAKEGETDDIRCEAETILAAHGSTQVFTILYK